MWIKWHKDNLYPMSVEHLFVSTGNNGALNNKREGEKKKRKKNIKIFGV